MKLPAGAWFGVVWVLVDWLGPWFSGILVPGVPAGSALVLVVGALYAGLVAKGKSIDRLHTPAG